MAGADRRGGVAEHRRDLSGSGAAGAVGGILMMIPLSLTNAPSRDRDSPGRKAGGVPAGAGWEGLAAAVLGGGIAGMRPSSLAETSSGSGGAGAGAQSGIGSRDPIPGGPRLRGRVGGRDRRG